MHNAGRESDESANVDADDGQFIDEDNSENYEHIQDVEYHHNAVSDKKSNQILSSQQSSHWKLLIVQNYLSLIIKSDSVSGADERGLIQNQLFLTLFMMFIAVTVVYFINNCNPTMSNKNQLKEEIEKMKLEFPSQQPDIWFDFSAGIKGVVRDSTYPAVFVMLYKDHEDTVTCLANKIARVAMHFLNSTKSVPIILDGDEIKKNETLLNDYAELIAHEKQRIEEHRTMIVKNLHSVPGKVAQSFYTLCDTYSPFVDKAVYLFTLKITTNITEDSATAMVETTNINENNNEDSTTVVAERELERIWRNEVDEDKLMPLITRITDSVVFIKPESNLPASCTD